MPSQHKVHTYLIGQAVAGVYTDSGHIHVMKTLEMMPWDALMGAER